VDLSGVIFVVLALVWAGYLLPKALRHHDEVARTRSVDEVSPQARIVVTAPPARPRRIRLGRRSADARTYLSAGARAARRRRRIVGALLLACLGTGVAAVLAALPVWAPVIPGVLLLGYLVLCRVLVRRDHARPLPARRTSARVAPARTVSQPVAQPVAQPATGAVLEPTAEAPGAAPVGGVPSTPVGSLDDTGTFDEVVVGVPAQRAASPSGDPAPGGSLWDPLPVTLPTYVGKQRAMRSVRTISLGEPGVSSSGRDAADSALVAGAQVPAGSQPGDDAPRVVGG